ncbi:MAG: hypothetical protein M1836_005661 [Candelina mexicana]|nr:MAG: hypothetical protein M1836_005661 [Candelina mexicana]
MQRAVHLRSSLQSPSPRTIARRSLLTQAISRGPSEPPLLEQTIGEHFASIVSRHGDRLAVISRHQNQRLTYDALDRRSNDLARGLAKLGVKQGNRVAVSLGNNIEYATVPFNPAFNALQVTSALNHLGASHLIVGAETNLPRKQPRTNIPMLRQIIPNIEGTKVESELVPSLQQVILVDNSDGRVDTEVLRSIASYEDVAEDVGSGLALPDQGLRSDDIVNIQVGGSLYQIQSPQLWHKE